MQVQVPVGVSLCGHKKKKKNAKKKIRQEIASHLRLSAIKGRSVLGCSYRRMYQLREIDEFQSLIFNVCNGHAVDASLSGSSARGFIPMSMLYCKSRLLSSRITIFFINCSDQAVTVACAPQHAAAGVLVVAPTVEDMSRNVLSVCGIVGRRSTLLMTRKISTSTVVLRMGLKWDDFLVDILSGESSLQWVWAVAAQGFGRVTSVYGLSCVVSIEMVFEFTRPASYNSDDYRQLAQKGVDAMQLSFQLYNGGQDGDRQISAVVKELMHINSCSRYSNFVMTQVLSVDHDVADDELIIHPVQPQPSCQTASVDDETAVAQRVLYPEDLNNYNEAGVTDVDRILENVATPVPVDDITGQALEETPDYDSDEYGVEDLVDWTQEVEREYGPLVNTVNLCQQDLQVDGMSVNVRNVDDVGGDCDRRDRRGEKSEKKK